MSLLTESGVNPEGKPFVVLTHDDDPPGPWQFTPQQARDFAGVLVAAAEAALHDAAFVVWMQGPPLSLTLEKAARILSEQRQYRADLDA